MGGFVQSVAWREMLYMPTIIRGPTSRWTRPAAPPGTGRPREAGNDGRFAQGAIMLADVTLGDESNTDNAIST